MVERMVEDSNVALEFIEGNSELNWWCTDSYNEHDFLFYIDEGLENLAHYNIYCLCNRCSYYINMQMELDVDSICFSLENSNTVGYREHEILSELPPSTDSCDSSVDSAGGSQISSADSTHAYTSTTTPIVSFVCGSRDSDTEPDEGSDY